ncbi:putative ferric-chelate reductase 1 isoform X1 [Bufo gargarizans]|uniref:putative ferric-chelate reductase 1 isoform X1 n=2 Tax=Bufo gargarizans TaxID=30331 RepID=UPI001CF42E54|nr:putative ferric-chelate reductase 1 isoform X1 [Bufo gargarizans]
MSSRTVAKMDLPVRILPLLLLTFLPMHCNGYPNGKVEQACKTMTPLHGADADPSFPPYSLSFSSVNHTGILGFRVTLNKEPGTSDFKGFLIQARAPGGDTPQGTFVVMTSDAQTLSCTTLDSAVSHTSRSMKSNASVIWLPPSKASTDIQFRATVVQSKNMFWTNVLSDIIPLAGAGPQHSASSLIQLLLCSTALFYGLFTF